VNPGVTRLVIVVALVAGGIAVLTNGFPDGATGAEQPPDTTSPSVSESPSPSPSPDQDVVAQQEGVLVQVFNGTFQPGLAGDFQIQLEGEGYLRAGDPGDAPDKPLVDSVVYYSTEERNKAQNQADAQLLSDTYLDSAPVERLPAAYEDVADPAADVIVVLGEDMAKA
jgi:hypothetical protein